MTNDEFYEQVAQILGTEYDCKPFPWYKRTRWNNRQPGSGRYPGFGVVRCFGDQVHIALHTPNINKIANSKEEAIKLLTAQLR